MGGFVGGYGDRIRGMGVGISGILRPCKIVRAFSAGIRRRISTLRERRENNARFVDHLCQEI